MTTAATPRHFGRPCLALCALSLLLLTAHSHLAQTSTSATDGSTPSALTPGAPAGAYPLSDFESINLYNGNLNFALPLLRLGGRGSVGASVALKIERHWRVKTLKPLPNCQLTGSSCEPIRMPDFNGWIITPDYGPGVLKGRQPAAECGGVTLTRLTFTTGDGTEYELRDRDYGGQPKGYSCYAAQGHLRGAVFVTADGTSATFTSDAVIYDSTASYPKTFSPSGLLKLRDGITYRIDEGLVTWVRDRNGNRVNYTYEGQRVKTITDSLGRVVTINYNVSDVAPYGACDQIVYKGFGGADRVVRVSRVKLEGVLRTTRPGDSALPKKVKELFPEFDASSSTDFNPMGVVAAVWLPDDGVNRRAYKFFYNVYGELARVELPTGGAIEYDFTKYSVTNDGIFRGVAERRVYADGLNLEGRTTYGGGPNPRTVDSYDASHVLLARTQHYFHGNPLDSLAQFPTDYAGWREGREYKTEQVAVTNGVASTTPLRRVEQQWRQRAPVGWWTGTAEKEPANDPRVVETVTTVEPGGANLVLKRSSLNPQTGAAGFDQFNNPTDVWEYDYYVGGATPPHALRHTHTDYVTTNNGVDYTSASGPHLRGLAAAQQVYAVNPATGAETLAVRSETRYDEAAYPLLSCGTSESPLLCSSAPQWDDLGAAPRGNATTQRHWLDTSNSWVETHAQYDQLGNVRYSWDAKGNLAQTSYLDSYCNGTLCGAAGFNANTFAFATANRSPKPDPSGTYGSAAELTTSAVYDFYTGLVYSATDANDKTTRYEYADPLDRPTAQVRPDQGRTDLYYSQPNEPLHVRTLADLDGARRLKAERHFDKMGRPTRSFTWENQDPGNPWLTVDTLYDALGRAWRVSNPYRSTGPGSAVDTNRAGAESTFDALGRVTQVKTTADGATVKSDYSGDRVLVTDQAGKQRISRKDALGRLKAVWEVTPYDPAKYPGLEAAPPALTAGLLPSAYGYGTDYFYDPAGNLRRVKQGGQQRFFAYDSLGRLVRAKYPEQDAFAAGGDFPALYDATSGAGNDQWSLGYAYDANGNLAKRTDARGTTATYTYDKLNRNTLVSYSDGTKEAERHYDGAINGKGRFWYFNWDANGNNARFDSHLAVDKYDEVGRPLKQRQRFFTGGASSLDYTTARTYDKAGNVLTQTYPSGHAVTYSYDAAGRTGGLSGGLGDGVERTYADQITYSEFGGIREERFGTQTQLYHKLHYNRRGQLYDVRLSTQSLQANEWDWNRGALVNYYSGNYAWEGDPNTPAGTDNNGNLRRQQHWVPDGSPYGYAFTQDTFDYDELNRLARTSESHAGPGGMSGQDFAQSYRYDRWGNRTVDLGQSPNVPGAQKDFERGDLANTNRLYAPGDLAHTGPNEVYRKMRYDAAGNLVRDAHTGAGGRAYDAENRMTAAVDSTGNWAYYTYDADGRRVKRKVADEEWWQVYGVGGELLAEYRAGATPYAPSKEYGYRGGELLVTMSSGDDRRLRRFVYNLYYGALRRDPTAQELQDRTNELASAGAQGQAQLLQKAKEVARSLFTQTTYELSPYRTEAQYVSDLYYTYLQRAPDDGGLSGWVAAAAGGAANRSNVCDAFQESAEFAAVISTLFGTAASDDARTDTFVHRFYIGAYGRGATAAELQQWRGALNTAAAQGPDAVKAQAEAMGRALFASQVSDLSLPAEQFVTNLYEGFLQRGPDAGGLSHWTGAAGTTAQSRQNVLEAFALCGPFRELAGTLYRETFWLVPDHLGTPRMVADKSGSLAGIKRHDYLPFGEEIPSGVAGRTIAQGYGQVDNVRQKLTNKERDDETGLDFFGARYYASLQGRFTSCDAVSATAAHLANPQRWNAYTYVINSPLSLYDPDGNQDRGKGGGRVIDVFITFAPGERGTGPDASKNKGQNWRGLIREGQKRGVKVNVYYKTDGGNNEDAPTVARGVNSLASPGRITIFAGHSDAGDNGKGGAVGNNVVMNDGTIGKGGAQTANVGGPPTVEPVPQINAAVVIVATCDASGAVSTFASNMQPGSSLIYNDAGPDGLTALDTDERSAFAAAQTLIRGGTVEEAAQAMQRVVDEDVNLTSEGKKINEGDKIKVQQPKPQ